MNILKFFFHSNPKSTVYELEAKASFTSNAGFYFPTRWIKIRVEATSLEEAKTKVVRYVSEKLIIEVKE